MSDSMIRLDHVTKLYGNVIGVNDLVTELPTDSYGLIGPNGSGKTTLINLLIGHFRPTIGTVEVFGKAPTKNRSLLRHVGLCPASDVLYPNVSAAEWVRFQVRLHGFSRTESKRLALEALEIVGMTKSMNRPMGTYSLGMRQRTKLAQAIAHRPQLLILDEPYNGLDPIGRSEMTTILKQWRAEGRGLLFASHVLHEIEAVTNSFLLIHGGRLLASGNLNEIERILAGTSQQIRIAGPNVEKLLHRLAGVPWIESLSLTQNPRELKLAVRDSAELYRQLPGWVIADNLEVQTIRSSDGELDALFDSLLRHHRGEAG
ncbi:ABC transporter ATP-binding protein [Roseiconus lacunae]|uniref:ABC transporter ATP-binding protein n=1 Tax=Roseiconus lacunae TaxID=2605694 RepID=UPI001E4154A4|nr:ABC transporter ATP-binding protein [Roseiconus lacunae]MCD0459341.1 ABC transporter ATP-binding protein [Roseiconus lacunae]